MGLFEGGMLLTFIMFVVFAGFYVAGIPVQTSWAFGNLSNEGNYRQYTTGLNDVNQATYSCASGNSGNIVTDQTQQRNAVDTIFQSIGGGLCTIPQMVTLLSQLTFGWSMIWFTLLGGTPFIFLGFILGVGFDFLKLIFLVQVTLIVIAAIRKGIGL
jgi:hypothetical protein